ncbi:TlpA family protein disulfide reductase [Novosphingobium sp.]|uniref:TlpA family protein disulfide reductase n=1 Tax=Novosphingobium sp. TaxID=1874826 RepID=UPI003D13B2CC
MLRINGLAVFSILALALATPASAEPDKLDLAKYRGKVVMVDFWASWCAPCKQAFPYMAALTHRYAPRDLVVITVNAERSRTPGEAFLRQVKSTLPVVWDGDATVVKAWQVNELPATILIDRKGKTRFRHTGFFLDKTPEYNAQIDTLIKER